MLQLVNTGTAPDSGDGDDIRQAYEKINNSIEYLASRNTTLVNVPGTAPTSPTVPAQPPATIANHHTHKEFYAHPECCLVEFVTHDAGSSWIASPPVLTKGCLRPITFDDGSFFADPGNTIVIPSNDLSLDSAIDPSQTVFTNVAPSLSPVANPDGSISVTVAPGTPGGKYTYDYQVFDMEGDASNVSTDTIIVPEGMVIIEGGAQVATILGQTPDNGSTSDLTHPSLTEDVQFGIFISNADEGGGFNGVLSSIGIWARDSNQLCQASFGQDNAPTDTVIAGHVDRNDCVAFRSTTVDGGVERVRSFVDEPIPNGVRIGASVFVGAPRNIPIGAMLFAGNGVRANVHQVTISRVVGAITEIDPAIDGRSVDMIVALTSTDQFDGVSHSGFAHQTVSFHAFENEVKQSSVSQSITWRSSNNIETVSNGGRANGIVVADGNHVQADPARHPELATTWEFAIDVVDGMIRIETIRAADENADPEMGLLVAHLDGDKATAGLMTTPSAPSADAVNVDFSPSIDSDLSGLLLQLNNVNTAGVDLIDDPMAGHYGMAMISAAPNADQFGFQTSWEVGVDPTNALTTQGDFLDVQADDGSPAIVVDSDDAEIVDDNLSVVFADSKTLQFPFLAITSPSALDRIVDRLDSIEQKL